MGLVENSAMLCLAILEGGKEVGRTKLQKMIYFADRYLGWNVGDYKLHFYGPYSRNIATTLQTIRDELIKETKSEFGPYQYELTEGGNDFVKAVNTGFSEDSLKTIRQHFAELASWSKDELELCATLDYVYRTTSGIKQEGLIEKVHDIKPNFSSESIKNAYDKWSSWKKDHGF